MVGAPKKNATLADYLAIPEDERFHEIVDGELVQKAQPTLRHGETQNMLALSLGPFTRRGGGPPERPGGWRIAFEVDVLFGGAPLRPDVSGWRRERMPKLSDEALTSIVPDWVCEVLSPSTASRDRIPKKRIFHRHQVRHYWILDPIERSLTVFRWQEDGYLEVLATERGETVRAEPFDAIEIHIDELFGDD